MSKQNAKDCHSWTSLIEEKDAQIKMLNEKLGYYEAKIRRLESEVRLAKAGMVS